MLRCDYFALKEINPSSMLIWISMPKSGHAITGTSHETTVVSHEQAIGVFYGTEQ